VEKNAVLSNYKADTYEAWQLWLERDIVKYICFSFCICSLVSKSDEFKVAPSPNCGAKFADFRLSKCGDTDRAPLICVIKLHHIPTSWQRSCGAAFFGVENYSAKNK